MLRAYFDRLHQNKLLPFFFIQNLGHWINREIPRQVAQYPRLKWINLKLMLAILTVLSVVIMIN